MGRKADPPNLKVLKGKRAGRDSGGRRISEPPKFLRYAPEKPDGMTRLASLHWDEVVPELTRLDLLVPTHGVGLRIMCEAYSRWHEAQIVIEADGVVIVNAMGNKVKNPAVSASEQASKDYRAWASEFGLTPSAEGRLLGMKERKPGGANPFDGAPPGEQAN